MVKKISKETIEKIRLARLGKKHSEETIKKLKESHKGPRPWMLGFKHSQESIHKMKESHKGQNKGIRPKNINEWIEKGKATRFQKGHKYNVGNKHFLGKKHSQETIDKIKSTKKEKPFLYTEDIKNIISERTKEALKDIVPWNKNLSREEILKHYKEGKIWNSGLTKETNETIKRMAENFTGEKHPNWRGGISFEPYSKTWNKEFRKSIKIRDNFMCQKCSMIEEDCKKIFLKPLDVHHVNYDKKLSIKENCITLCSRCHGETTTNNREAWISFYQIVLHDKYGYTYEDNKIVLDFKSGDVTPTK